MRAHSIAVTAICAIAGAAHAEPFQYQGRLTDSGQPFTTAVNLRFSLFDGPAAGTQVGSTFDTIVTPVDGLVSVLVDCGVDIPDTPLYPQIAARPIQSFTFTTLTPRQPLTPAPQALEISGTVQRLTIGDETTPRAPLHIQQTDTGFNENSVPIPGTAAVIEGQPAIIDMVSPDFGAFGSYILLREVQPDGQLTDIWGIVRRPSGLDSGLGFQYIDTTGAVQALDILPNGQVVIPNDLPAFNNEGGSLVIGDQSALHMNIDSNEILVKNNTASAELTLSREGGGVAIGGAITIINPPLQTLWIEDTGIIPAVNGQPGVVGFRKADGSMDALGVAQLHLPNGAEIIGFAADITDASTTSNVQVELRRERAIGSGSGAVSTVSTTTPEAPGSTFRTGTIDPALVIVDNNLYTYSISVNLNGPGNVALQRIRVQYQDAIIND